MKFTVQIIDGHHDPRIFHLFVVKTERPQCFDSSDFIVAGIIAVIYISHLVGIRIANPNPCYVVNKQKTAVN